MTVASTGVNGAAQLLAQVLEAELVVPSPSTSDGTLANVYSTPPITVVKAIPAAVIRAYDGDFRTSGQGIAEVMHHMGIAVYCSAYSSKTILGQIEQDSRAYTESILTAIYKHLRFGGTQIDPSGSFYFVMPKKYKIGLGLYAGYQGSGITTQEDAVPYVMCMILLDVQEKRDTTLSP